MTATQIIRGTLILSRGAYLAVHEITEMARANGHYISDNAAASRLAIDLKGEVVSRYRAGKRFKEWSIPVPPSGPDRAAL